MPLSESSKLTSFGPNHEYLERIKAAYDFASGELLTLIKNKVSFTFTSVLLFDTSFFLSFGGLMSICSLFICIYWD